MSKPEVELAGLVVEAKFTFLKMAHVMLGADAVFAGWTLDAIQRAIDLGGRGWRIGLEILADESGAAMVSLIAIAPDGQRETLGTVRETAPRAAN